MVDSSDKGKLFPMTKLNTQPKWTYLLNISAGHSKKWGTAIKSDVIKWLQERGIFDFVEGAVDDLDLDPQYETVVTGGAMEFDTSESPIQIYKYDESWLVDLKQQMLSSFGDQINLDIEKIESSVWTEGWKESFRPIETDQFIVHPPWDKPSSDGPSKIFLEIEPGMAFGTGQHATTMGCLRLWEKHHKTIIGEFEKPRLIDVGTGSGILAIAAAKSGVSVVVGTDIDPDAILAVKNNADVNGVKISAQLGSVPSQMGTFELGFANILTPILCRILPELVKILSNNAYCIFSGVLASEEEFFTEQLAANGLTVIESIVTDDWLGILAKKGT